jgi:iron complex transport system substrate-binding protein
MRETRTQPRIVSLIASATEIVCALGFRDRLVGRSHECDFPESVRNLPVCTESKVKIDAPSAEFDQEVKRIIANALSVYRVDTERLRELRPDLIVTQDHCRVCAVSLNDVEQALCAWMESRPRIVSLSPNSLADIWQDIRIVANALGAPERGEELITALQTRMSAVSERCRSLQAAHPSDARDPTVACIEWIEPLMAAGNWVPELVEMAAGINLFGAAGKHSPWMTWDQLREKDADVMIVMPCGFDIPRTRAEMAPLTSRADWMSLKAVRNGRVYLVDGNQYFNRPGPRLADSLEIIAEIVHPQIFPPTYEHQGWERL